MCVDDRGGYEQSCAGEDRAKWGRFCAEFFGGGSGDGHRADRDIGVEFGGGLGVGGECGGAVEKFGED